MLKNSPTPLCPKWFASGFCGNGFKWLRITSTQARNRSRSSHGRYVGIAPRRPVSREKSLSLDIRPEVGFAHHLSGGDRNCVSFTRTHNPERNPNETAA